jgi:hypothetical protein
MECLRGGWNKVEVHRRKQIQAYESLVTVTCDHHVTFP